MRMGVTIAGPSGSGFRRVVIAGLFVLGMAGGESLAQSFQTVGTGLHWGRFNVYPSVGMGYGYDSNIFYTSQDIDTATGIVSSREFQLQPRFIFDLPLGDSWVRWAYAPVFRNYSTAAYSPTKQWSQNFDLDGHLRLGPRFYTTFRDEFILGPQELQSVDPGGEVNFGDVPFRNNSPSVEVGCYLGARQGVSVVWNYNSVQFQGDDAGFYNYRGHGLQARYNYRISDATTTFVYAGDDNTQQDRITVVNNETVNEIIDVETRSVGVGLNQVLNRAVTTSVTVGYQQNSYTGGSLSDYRGAVLAGNATWRLSDVSRLSFLVRRQPYSSFYLNNNYYLNRAVGVDLTRQVGASWYWRAGGGFENNTYSDALDITGVETTYCPPGYTSIEQCPSAGVIRRDRAWRLEAGFGGMASRSMRWFVGYNTQSRSSNIQQADADGFGDPFAYNVNRIFLRIEVGWL